MQKGKRRTYEDLSTNLELYHQKAFIHSASIRKDAHIRLDPNRRQKTEGGA